MSNRKMTRRASLSMAAAAVIVLAGCQVDPNAGLPPIAEQTFVPVQNGAALMAIVRGRTVVYSEDSTRGAGLRQTFNSDGTTIYGDQPRVWNVIDGTFCSSANAENPPETWPCFPIAVNEAGTVIRWQSEPDENGTQNTWYGLIR